MKEKPLLTLVYAYYENPGMLKHQARVWNSYDPKVLDRCQFIITDDCSKRNPITELLPLSNINHRVFRITRKVPWNWLACRNIGARYADGAWLLLTDMDHVLTPEGAKRLTRKLKNMNPNWVYLFTRVNTDGSTYKPHDDSFLMTKKLFWKIGGYDEELAGNYGTSGRYRNRAFKKSQGHLRLHIPLTRFSRADIPDANTTDLERKKNRDPYAIAKIEQKKKIEGRAEEILMHSFPFEELT